MFDKEDTQQEQEESAATPPDTNDNSIAGAHNGSPSANMDSITVLIAPLTSSVQDMKWPVDSMYGQVQAQSTKIATHLKIIQHRLTKC